VLNRLIHSLDPEPAGDADLLARVIAGRDEAAFAALVRRHGPMVMTVCRRVTGHEQDAEDAFQAAFLVLARKATAIRPRGQVGNWLFGVACRVARKVRARAARVRARETTPAGGYDRMGASAAGPFDQTAVILAEVERLPDLYRVPLVLCDLQDRPRKAVAAELGIPEGTLSSRLTAARTKLAARLARRGIAVPGATVGSVLTAAVVADGAVPGPLAATTVREALAFAAGAAPSGPAAEAARQVLSAGRALRWAAAISIVVGVVTVGVIADGQVKQPRPDPPAGPGPQPRPAVAGPVAEPKPAAAPPKFHTRLEQAEWVLTAIDAVKKTIVLAEPAADRGDVRTIVMAETGVLPAGFTMTDVPVDPAVEVTVDGIATRLDRLPTGLRVRVTLKGDRLTVTKITGRSPTPPAFMYTIVARDPDKRTIAVRLRGTGEELADLPVAADAAIDVLQAVPVKDGIAPVGGPGKFEDLAVGRPVALDLRVTPEGRPVVTRVRVGQSK
jgi:RNA polymerase sigma factor (sigma-70 family)